MYGPAEHHHGPTLVHLPMHPPMPQPHMGYCNQYQQPSPNVFYPPPGYYWPPPPLQRPVYHNAFPPHEDFVARHAYAKAPGFAHPASTSPPPPTHHRPGHQAVPLQQNVSPLPSSARGPPCKPRQSGWAVWVGNLPQYTTVCHVKDYFAAGAADTIESVFLITKTNCAFVNYKTESACLEAIQRFDHSLFRGNRIVCRVRRDSLNSRSSTSSSSAPPSEVPSLSPGSRALSVTDTSSDLSSGEPLIVRGDDQAAKRNDSVACLSDSLGETIEGLKNLSPSPKKDNVKLFILKSLTLQDLLVSTRDGSWVTQPHNEEKLDEAFNTAEDVYLIFSVNKSGQYFGYARMESQISKGPAASLPSKERSVISPQQSEPISQGGDAPRSIPTPATATAPEGHIVDDSARGTIFWEAKRSEGEKCEAEDAGNNSDDLDAVVGGRQFSIRWISTTQVPFHATRGLRNPLNGNREVKIARDGTELDPHVGSRLLQLFHRTPPSGPMGWRS